MNESTDATSIFAPLWRRKWLILAVGLIVGAASYAYYKRQPAVYQATTQVFLGAASEEGALPGTKSSTKGQGAASSDQTAVINAIVVEQVRTQLKDQHKGQLAKGKVKAKAQEKSQFITITTEAHTARGAALLANTTAQLYIKRQKVDHVRAITTAIAIDRRQLRKIEAVAQRTTTNGKGKTTTQPSTSSIIQAANLNSKINQLEATLATGGAQQVKPAHPGNTVQLSPKPRKNAIFGFVIGVVLASIAAYALGRLDRRVRTLASIESLFKANLLAALPKVSRPIVRREGQPAPSRVLVEPLRRLQVSLRLGDTLKRELPPPRIILFVSPDAGDGKSTIAAGLSLVERDAGERVAVVEANFRRPVMARLLGLDGPHGLADVLMGTLDVEQAMQRVLPFAPPADPEQVPLPTGVATAVESRAGSLFLLAGGGPVSNPPAALAQPAMSELLRQLASDFDYVLVDAPSPLQVSDVMPLLNAVDGIVLVARVGQTREASAQRLVQLLSNTPSAPVLGVAANCVKPAEIERYGFSAPGARTWPGRLTGR